MTNIVKSSNTETMTTIQLREMINEARTAFGEVKVRNDQLLARIEDELEDELGVCKTIAHPQSGVQMRYYDLTLEQCTLVGMRESKGVRRSVLAKLKELEAQQVPAVPKTFADALRLAADQQEQIDKLALENHQQAEKIDVLESMLAKGVSAPEFCRRLNGVNTMAVNCWLKDKGWLFESGGWGGSWRVSSYARDKYMTERAFEVTGSQGPFSVSKPVLLRKGASWLIQQYMQGRLPMKKTWDGVFKHDMTGVLEVDV